MAYPPPPGTTGNSSLPAKPPVAAGGFNKTGFRPAFSSASSGQQQPPAQTYGPAPGTYGPSTQPPSLSSSSSNTANRYGSSQPSYSQYRAAAAPGTSAPTGVSATSTYAYPQQTYQQNQNHQQYYHNHQQQQQQPSAAHNSYGPSYPSTTPQIKNPFAAPAPAAAANTTTSTTGASAASAAAAAAAYDFEMAAQIAQWQSAYGSGDATLPAAAPIKPTDQQQQQQPQYFSAEINNPNEKKKTVVRHGGGKKWTDDTLLEWDPSHLRLFVGNLAGETTDDSLLKAFSRWKSVQKARVVRDKRTTKSKGFGFVSFSDADDFFQAAKEMNGKYIQSHPVVVRKANTEIKPTNVKEKGRKGGNNTGGGGNYNNKKNGGGGGYEPDLGARTGAGVTKPGQKTKNGLRILG